MNNSTTILSGLPDLDVADIKSHLGAYDRAFITKNANGQYKHTSALVLHNGDYDEYVGTVFASEVFTPAEHIIAFIKTFREFPYRSGDSLITYTGAKDWKAINSNWTDVKFNNLGDLVFS